jgi:hypothetical protein
MKMIWHETIRKQITVWQEKSFYLFKEVQIIFGSKEYYLFVVAPVINMI